MKILNITSYAKLNLRLEVLRKRKDNYHSLFTLFEKIDLSDQIKLSVTRGAGIKITSSGFSLPTGPANLAYKAANLLKQKFKIRSGLLIHIKKRIPVSAGLGGGSSNAASVLTGLNELWELGLKTDQLLTFARSIGADVPFFIYNNSFACATSRGDKIIPLKKSPEFWHVLIRPTIKVSSALAYKNWDKIPKKSLTRAENSTGLTTVQSRVRMVKSVLSKKDTVRFKRLLFNSLEQVSIDMYPEIQAAKEALSNLGLDKTLMTGSGPTVFGLLFSRKEAYSVARQLRKFKKWDVFVAKTV